LNEANQPTSSSTDASQNDQKPRTTAKTTDGQLFVPSLIPVIIGQLLPKLPITLLMTVVSAVIGLGLGFLIAIVKLRKIPILQQLFNVFVSFMRGTPQLVQLFLSFYGLPILVEWVAQKMNMTVNVNAIPALVYVFIAFGLNEAAYTSETFRAALLSVNKSEIEAARSIGLTNAQTMLRIILPSALIVALPNLVNSLISLLKATSLAFTVTIIDIMGQTRIIAGANLRFFEAYIAVALVYWVLCVLIEQVAKRVERKLNVDL
jgi:His/Glu/Gln/Arg/opine family amino acid ABC transporter permease subunit